MANIMTEAVSTRGGDIVEQVAAKGRLSGKSHEQKESRYELNQVDSEDRRRAAPVNGVTDFFSIIYVPGRLMVSGNAAATAQNILASERLSRLGIVSN
jgi:hypothetical protein